MKSREKTSTSKHWLVRERHVKVSPLVVCKFHAHSSFSLRVTTFGGCSRIELIPSIRLNPMGFPSSAHIPLSTNNLNVLFKPQSPVYIQCLPALCLDPAFPFDSLFVTCAYSSAPERAMFLRRVPVRAPLRFFFFEEVCVPSSPLMITS